MGPVPRRFARSALVRGARALLVLLSLAMVLPARAQTFPA